MSLASLGVKQCQTFGHVVIEQTMTLLFAPGARTVEDPKPAGSRFEKSPSADDALLEA